MPAHAGRHRLRAWLAGALSCPAVRAAHWSSAERGSQGRRRREKPAAGAAGAMTVEQNVLQQSAAQKVRRPLARPPPRPRPRRQGLLPAPPAPPPLGRRSQGGLRVGSGVHLAGFHPLPSGRLFSWSRRCRVFIGSDPYIPTLLYLAA